MTTCFPELVGPETLLSDGDERFIGGKAWNLLRLRMLGFDVPDWWVATTRVFDAAVGPHRTAINEILTGVDFACPASVERGSMRIRDMLRPADIPADTRDRLRQALDSGRSQTRYAVRSSALGEDSSENSFAGQLDSFLNIAPEDVPDHIRKVWLSAYAPGVLGYRHRKGLPIADISVAVIVQKMVPAAAGGVMFTRDPDGLATVAVIAAAYGLGEGVTAGSVEADTYRIDWTSQLIAKDVPAKNSQIVAHGPAGGSGIAISPVAAGQGCRPVLRDAQIRRLCADGLAIARHFGRPQDIEWAIDGDGRPWFLQTRPIVAAPSQEPTPSVRIWDNANIVESFPGQTLPLTFSFARRIYEITFSRLARRFFPFRWNLAQRLGLFSALLGLFEGRVYINLLNWYAMLSYLPGVGAHRAAWDQMFGISEKTALKRRRLSVFDSLWAVASLGWALFAVRRNGRRFFKWFDTAYGRFAAIDPAMATAEDLQAHLDHLMLDMSPHWYRTIVNDFAAMTYYDRLQSLCRRWLDADDPNLHLRLLHWHSSIESVAPDASLNAIAALIDADPAYRALIAGKDDAAAWVRIRDGHRSHPLKVAIQQYLNTFGDRGPEDLKLEVPSFRDRPELLIALIKARLGLRAVGGSPPERETVALPWRMNPIKYLVLAFVLRQARASLAARENMRFARSRVYGLARRFYRQIGEDFARQGLLAEPSDIHYLTAGEISDFIRGLSVNRTLGNLVDKRRADYTDAAAARPADRMRTSGIPYLDLTYADGVDPSRFGSASGTGCAGGAATGIAKIVDDPRDIDIGGDQILVAASTDPGWVFMMTVARGIVVEKGSVLSHTAIIGRELGIPTVVGVANATKHIPDGAEMSINGSTGEIRWQ